MKYINIITETVLEYCEGRVTSHTVIIDIKY